MATKSPKSSTLLSPTTNNNHIDVIEELLHQGYQSAFQLKFLLQKPLDTDGTLSIYQHMAIVLSSFTHSLSLLTSDDIEIAQNLVVSGENEPPLPDCCPDLKSLEGRSAPPATRSRRGCYKRRRSEQTWSIVSGTTDDKHAWRKYGQKEIQNSKFPRSYLRCTRKYEQGCKALKQVQRIQQNPELYQITYIGHHTCKDILKTPQVMMVAAESDNNNNDWESLFTQSDSNNIPNEEIVTNVHPIKQEDHHHPKEEITTSDDFAGSSLDDPSLWSELKDLSEASMVPSLSSDSNNNNYHNADNNLYSCSCSLDFGVVEDSVHFGSQDFHFDA